MVVPTQFSKASWIPPPPTETDFRRFSGVFGVFASPKRTRSSLPAPSQPGDEPPPTRVIGQTGTESVEKQLKSFVDTSTEPYDRHHYRVWLKDGTYMDCESFEDAKEIWRVIYHKPKTIEVTQAKGQGSGKGFN